MFPGLELEPRVSFRRVSRCKHRAGFHVNKQESMRRSRFPFEPGRVAPEIFQTVKGTFVPVEDVNHYLQVIEHDPLARRKSVNRHRSNGMILAQSRLDFICDGF